MVFGLGLWRKRRRRSRSRKRRRRRKKTRRVTLAVKEVLKEDDRRRDPNLQPPLTSMSNNNIIFLWVLCSR